MFLGGGAKRPTPPVASFMHARTGLAREPRAGLHRNVHVTLSAGFAESSQKVTRRDVLDAVPDEADPTSIDAIATATVDARIQRGYCHRSCPGRDDSGRA